MTISIDGVFVPQKLRLPTLAPAFVALALAGEPHAKSGFYGRTENWIMDRIDLKIFPDCRELLRWMSSNRMGGKWQANPDLLAQTYLAQAFAILEKAKEMKKEVPPSLPEEAPSQPVLTIPAPPPTPQPAEKAFPKPRK